MDDEYQFRFRKNRLHGQSAQTRGPAILGLYQANRRAPEFGACFADSQ
jgi:hypothetical protein